MESKALTDIPPPARLKQAAIARALNVSRQAIHELVKRGILNVGEDGMLDVQETRVAIAHRLRPDSKALGAVLDIAPPDLETDDIEPDSSPAAEQRAEPTAPGAASDPAMTSYHVARTVKMSADARLQQIELARAEKTLLTIHQVTADWFAIARELRDRHTTTARRVAAELANCNSADGCETILLREFNDMLKDTVEKLARTELGHVAARALELG